MKTKRAAIAAGYLAAPHEEKIHPRESPAATAYTKLFFKGLSLSIDLRKKKMNNSKPQIPTVSSSKNPADVLVI